MGGFEMRKIVILAAGLLAASAIAQPAIEPIFGLPIGAKLDRVLDGCALDNRLYAELRRDYCSLGPDVKPGTAGRHFVRVPWEPRGFRVPNWIEPGSELVIRTDDSGEVFSIYAETSGPQSTVIEAVTERFGKPTYRKADTVKSRLGGSEKTQYVRWEPRGLDITHGCITAEKCTITFTTAKGLKILEAEVKARRDGAKL